MGFPHQTVNDIVGISYWGESLLSVPGNFPGINNFGARRRVASAWLPEEIRLQETIPLKIPMELRFLNIYFFKNKRE